MPCGTWGGYEGSQRVLVPGQLLDGTAGVLHGLFSFPSGVQWRAVRVMLSCSLLITWPIHLHHLRMMMVSMLSWLERASSRWLEMVSDLNTRRILLRFIVWRTYSLVILLFVLFRRFWRCWHVSWCHFLLLDHTLPCCLGKWTPQMSSGLLCEHELV